MKIKEIVVGIIILIGFVATYLGYDFFQKEKIIVINNQDNKSTPQTVYDVSIDTDLGPIKKNLTLIDSNADIYRVNVTQEITFFKGFSDDVIIRNILFSGNIESGVYDKNTRGQRYTVDSKDISLKMGSINEPEDIFVKNLGTSKINTSFFITADISELRKAAPNNNFTNAIFVVSYYPQLSLDIHIVDKNVKQTLTLNPTYYFYVDLDKAFSNQSVR